MDHGELATDLIRGYRHVLADLLCIADYVEVGACWFDLKEHPLDQRVQSFNSSWKEIDWRKSGETYHNHICSFVNVPSDGSPSQASTSRWKLVALPIPKLRNGARGIPKRSIKTTRELGSIAHKRDTVCDTGLDKLQLDSPDAPIVHVGRRDAMGTCLGISERNIADPIDRKVIVEAAVLSKDAAVAMGSIFAETDVGDYVKAWETGADETDCLDDGTLWVVGGSPEGVFGAGFEGHAEQDYGAQTLADQWFEMRSYLVDAAAVLVWEGGNGRFFVIVVGNEERVYEHRLRTVSDRTLQAIE